MDRIIENKKMFDESYETLEDAIQTYGQEPQLDMVIEEMSELTKAICKYKRGSYNIVEIIEEMADVYIMLEQLQIMFEIPPMELSGQVYDKIKRLKNRLEKENG